jgi:surface polysaccharide O-acyltransferase-like enzyme
VLSHCYDISLSNFGHNDNFFAGLFRNIVSGSSAFFVFISGFLFLKMYNSDKMYFDFVKKKIINVYLPFIFFISIDLYYLFYKILTSFFFNQSTLQHYLDAIYNFDFISTYLLGKSISTFGVLWYIPFIMVVYTLSPLFFRFSELNSKKKIFILSISTLISFLLFRNNSNQIVTIFINVIYFAPFYLLGIFIYQHEEVLLLKISNRVVLFFLGVSFFFGFSNRVFPTEILQIFDFMLIQKVLFCFVFYIFFKRLSCSKLHILNLFAKYSFGIYFVHPVILNIFVILTSIFNIDYRSEKFIVYLFISISILLISLGLTLIIKTILGSRSRYFIGC